MGGIGRRACEHKNPPRDTLGRCMECWPGGTPRTQSSLTDAQIDATFIVRCTHCGYEGHTRNVCKWAKAADKELATEAARRRGEKQADEDEADINVGGF